MKTRVLEPRALGILMQRAFQIREYEFLVDRVFWMYTKHQLPLLVGCLCIFKFFNLLMSAHCLYQVGSWLLLGMRNNNE